MYVKDGLLLLCFDYARFLNLGPSDDRERIPKIYCGFASMISVSFDFCDLQIFLHEFKTSSKDRTDVKQAPFTSSTNRTITDSMQLQLICMLIHYLAYIQYNTIQYTICKITEVSGCICIGITPLWLCWAWARMARQIIVFTSLSYRLTISSTRDWQSPLFRLLELELEQLFQELTNCMLS